MVIITAAKEEVKRSSRISLFREEVIEEWVKISCLIPNIGMFVTEITEKSSVVIVPQTPLLWEW